MANVTANLATSNPNRGCEPDGVTDYIETLCVGVLNMPRSLARPLLLEMQFYRYSPKDSSARVEASAIIAQTGRHIQ